jgi:hypothetical protein
MPKGNSIVISHSLLYVQFITEAKKEEYRPHLLAGFSLVLGFTGQIFCSFVWMMCICACSFILYFSYFLNSSHKLELINMGSKQINHVNIRF